MTIDEAIAHAREVVKRNRILLDSDELVQKSYDAYFDKLKCEKCVEEHEQLAEWLEELKELRICKEKMEMQYIGDVGNPLEPLKLESALKSEIMKYEFRKKNKPEDINILDYTVMYALKHCLEEFAGGVLE